MPTFSLSHLPTFLQSLAKILLFAFAFLVPIAPSNAQSALQSISQFASLMPENGGGVSSLELIDVLESAAAEGQPMALWQLGEMYENGVGVEQDQVRAFGYFSRIANEHASAPPNSVEADIVARSFMKVGDYYKVGLPDAGISADQDQARTLLFHAASYFGDADAQYHLGLLYLEGEEMATNPLLSMRWLSLAAHKGHVPAQAVLGDLLFNGLADDNGGFEPQPVEGLMWLTLAHEGTFGSDDEIWIYELLTRAMSISTTDQRVSAQEAANSARPRIAKN